MPTSTASNSSTQLFLRGVTLAELAACLLEDRPRTPECMRAEYLDQVMSPWNFDFSSNIALPSRALRDLVADTPIDPDGDIIQAIIHAGVQAVNDPDVIAGVDLDEACVYGTFSVAGLEEPILLAMYSQPLPVSTIPEDPSETEIRSAQRAISDAGRDRNCKLVHLCPICEKTYTTKSSLKEHLRTHANQYEYVCDGPNSCGGRFNTRHYLLSHQKHCNHGTYAITG
ncbi:hypothetical protein K525DRAFT_252971 [Schizophyllum commune Loenen D]|nr:hypothetical protein K525DRAFT_252971 [Schizophyllum commune Loenen D]